MLIYGWTLSAKVAVYGWNRRKSVKTNTEENQDFVGARKSSQVVDPLTNRRKQSYAAVVKEDMRNKMVNPAKMGDKVMSWRIQYEEEDWIARSAVGVLKDFSDITAKYMVLLYNAGGKDFFTNIGRQVGDTIWVDDSTAKKERLDRGRLLIWMAVDSQMEQEVTVKVGGKKFPMKVVALPDFVTDEWINRHLGLKPVTNRQEGAANRSFLEEPIKINGTMTEVVPRQDRGQNGIGRGFWIPEETKGRVSDNNLKLLSRKMEERKLMGERKKSFFKKGKGGWIKKSSVEKKQKCNTCLCITEKEESDQSGNSSSNYDSDSMSDNHFYKGDCSTQAQNEDRYGPIGMAIGPQEDLQEKEDAGPNIRDQEEQNSGSIQDTSNGSDGVDSISPMGSKETTNKKASGLKEHTVESQGNVRFSIENVTEYDKGIDHRGLNLYVDLNGQGDGMEVGSMEEANEEQEGIRMSVD
ncbi:hypothetical protein Q3G72_007747 [Acer saccharum]|nr:hypothetical protein Q3G72_007747 [Acer saccharum]